MKIGILGSGDVGRRLGDGLIELGHTVRIGTRNPKKSDVIQWISDHEADGGKALTGSFVEAASFGEAIVIATSWDGTYNAINMANPKNFNGKIVIDVTNPLDFSHGIPPKLALGHSDSAGETIQRLIPGAKVVKAFNTVGNSHFIHPDFPNGGPPTMFICGNDNPSKKFLTDNILGKFGWETIDIGGIDGARLLEPLAFLWITYYFRNGSGEHSFKLLRK
jgi:8-hydroxy-5-deazaflavin:NADPH oxidoreductase